MKISEYLRELYEGQEHIVGDLSWTRKVEEKIGTDMSLRVDLGELLGRGDLNGSEINQRLDRLNRFGKGLGAVGFYDSVQFEVPSGDMRLVRFKDGRFYFGWSGH